MKYRKKPVVVEAFEFGIDDIPIWFVKALSETDEYEPSAEISECKCIIHVYNGRMAAFKGDMIIKGIDGEIYPCKKDIFEATYEKVEQ